MEQIDKPHAEGMPERQIEVTEDGLTVDQETGEILDVQIPADFLDSYGQPLMSDGMANWVMRRILRADSEAASSKQILTGVQAEMSALAEKAMAKLEATPEMVELRAIERNAARIVDQAYARSSFFRDRFVWLLVAYAKSKLDGRAKSLTTPYGSIAITTYKPKLSIANDQKFIKWADKHCPEAVKREPRISVLLKAKDLVEKLMTGEKSREAAGLSLVTPPEKVEIKTGVDR